MLMFRLLISITMLSMFAIAQAPAPTNTTIASSANPNSTGQTTTFTVTVSNPTGTDVPTGSVTLKEGNNTIGSGTLNFGKVSIDLSLGIGTHQIIAIYSGTGTFATSASVPITQNITQESAITEFDAVLGVGSLIVGPNITDYMINTTTNVVQTTNLGRATPQLLAGGAFSMPFPNFRAMARKNDIKNPWYAFLSLKFSTDSNHTFNGYVLGGSYKIGKYFAFMTAFALTPIDEPSPGFRVAASQAVSQNSNIPVYQRFNANSLSNNTPNAFDGFPLFVQTSNGSTSNQLFSGRPLLTHYHGGFVIGVVVSPKIATIK